MNSIEKIDELFGKNLSHAVVSRADWEAVMADIRKAKDTPAAQWRENGEPDPHDNYSPMRRADLCMGDRTDDQIANDVFVFNHRTGIESIMYLTAAKERIRWLSRQLVKAQGRIAELEGGQGEPSFYVQRAVLEKCTTAGYFSVFIYSEPQFATPTHDLIGVYTRAQSAAGPLITSEMKAECMGEFEITIDSECGECSDDGPDEDCEICRGNVIFKRKIPVPWDTCKQIYKRMAALAPKSAVVPDEETAARELLAWWAERLSNAPQEELIEVVSEGFQRIVNLSSVLGLTVKGGTDHE